MNKDQLKSILSTGYDAAKWRTVLTDIFGARTLLKKKQKIPLPSNDLALGASELGSFETSDKRVVGLYQVDLTDRPRIWQNRVGLRSLLRNVYTNNVDAALVVFVQGDKWRLSFISEIRDLNDDGTIETKTTQPKRFTYLCGEGEKKTTTATQRLYTLAGTKFSLDEIRKAFSVEALNKEFYTKVSKKFYELVGATEGKGKKQVKHERILKLPSVSDAERTTYQEFAVRLIGRIVFCWFLKEKKSDKGLPLIPAGLIESGAVKKN